MEWFSFFSSAANTTSKELDLEQYIGFLWWHLPVLGLLVALSSFGMYEACKKIRTTSEDDSLHTIRQQV